MLVVAVVGVLGSRASASKEVEYCLLGLGGLGWCSSLCPPPSKNSSMLAALMCSDCGVCSCCSCGATDTYISLPFGNCTVVVPTTAGQVGSCVTTCSATAFPPTSRSIGLLDMLQSVETHNMIVSTSANSNVEESICSRQPLKLTLPLDFAEGTLLLCHQRPIIIN